MASRRDSTNLHGSKNEGLSLIPALGSQSQVQGQSSGTSGTDKIDNYTATAAQHQVDACLHTVFDRYQESGNSSNYLPYINTTPGSLTVSQINDYIYQLQRGGFIQPFGCLVCVKESDFSVIAFSGNAPEMLGFSPRNEIPQTLFMGVDVRTLFVPSESLMLASSIRSSQLCISNPLILHSKVFARPFYAILHQIDVGIIIDLEPLESEIPSMFVAGAMQSQKLSMWAISQLQSLPQGDLMLLCDNVVRCVREYTGYDRVMVYKFHEDEHGEVVAESKVPDLESYLGLHYPATDIPQAARYMFQQSRTRIIVDCRATFVPVIQDESLDEPLSLVRSTLRAPHGCHAQFMANMGSVGSLVMAVIIHDNDKDTGRVKDKERLWGLVVCHHKYARYITFPVRQACEYVMQAFGLQLNMEMQLSSRLIEKQILRTQTLLCGMLVRNSLPAIVTESPNIMDLVKCDGAALYFGGRSYPLGITPTEAQIKDIVEWLFACHKEVAGFSTDSLVWAKYPGANFLGPEVCGMAVARITSSDFVFWFRSNSSKEIKWGGEKHHPDHKDEEQMHPRHSFKVFMEVVKIRSLLWDDAEIDAIHSLQLIIRDLLKNVANNNDIMHDRVEDEELQGKKELSPIATEMIRLIETANAPIFAVNADGRIDGWNTKIAELTGLPADQAIGRSLIDELVYEESKVIVAKLVSQSLRGKEEKNVEIKMRKFGLDKNKMAINVVVSSCCSKDDTGNSIGVCFVGQDVTLQKDIMEKYIKLEGDYKAIIHSPNPLTPPIFGSDLNTCCFEWNYAMEKVTGWSRNRVMGLLLVGEVFGNCCKLKDQDTMTRLMIILHNAIAGQDTNAFPFLFFDRNGQSVQALLSAHKRVNIKGLIIGAFCFLQIPSPDFQQDLELERQQALGLESMQKLSYICEELKCPLSGVHFTNLNLEGSELTDNQNQLLQTRGACVKQISQIITDVDQEILDQGLYKFDKAHFLLGNMIDAVISQVMLVLKERDVQLIHNIPEEIKRLTVYGDEARIQRVLTAFLSSMANYAQEGWVVFGLQPIMQQNSDDTSNIPIDFRIGCSGEGLPPEVVQEMFHMSGWVTPEGLGLSTCRKMLSQMNGCVEYIKEPKFCYFTVKLDLPMTTK
ncbi:Phytochrome [Heracleum sosnowskyi]|uniref:Phytochrome n=1 Tax=Heracleum sosnowskyi TaxID=360622 RepID=A0AAD8IL37_9APIA|nr:Phytochrome [Heracleum sosnowskyi]